MHPSFERVHHRSRNPDGSSGPIIKTTPNTVIHDGYMQYVVANGGVYTPEGEPIEPDNVPFEVMSVIENFSYEIKMELGLIEMGENTPEEDIGPDDPNIRDNMIREAIVSLDADDDDNWTSKGWPKVAVVSARVGFDVSSYEIKTFDISRDSVEEAQEE